MSGLPPKADVAERNCHVRFVPQADSCAAAGPRQRNAHAFDDFMNKNPATTFGHQINEASQADELRKTWKMKEENEKKFGAGKGQADWGLFDQRSGMPK
jgi:hypothetical protein